MLETYSVGELPVLRVHHDIEDLLAAQRCLLARHHPAEGLGLAHINLVAGGHVDDLRHRAAIGGAAAIGQRGDRANVRIGAAGRDVGDLVALIGALVQAGVSNDQAGGRDRVDRRADMDETCFFPIFGVEAAWSAGGLGGAASCGQAQRLSLDQGILIVERAPLDIVEIIARRVAHRLLGAGDGSVGAAAACQFARIADDRGELEIAVAQVDGSPVAICRFLFLAAIVLRTA